MDVHVISDGRAFLQLEFFTMRNGYLVCVDDHREHQETKEKALYRSDDSHPEPNLWAQLVF